MILPVLAGGYLLALHSAHAAPVNDDFTNRTVLTGSSLTFTGTLAGATSEAGEPFDYGLPDSLKASVWWSWTASVTGTVTVEAYNFSTNILKQGELRVWAGTNLPSGYAIAGAVLDGRHPFLKFAAAAGTTYSLRTSGPNFGDFTLKLTETNVPIILIQPLSHTVPANGSVFFGVIANSYWDYYPLPPSNPYYYQWLHNGVPISGETFPILGMNHLTTNDSGNYSVIVSNASGATLSETAVLNIAETSPPQLISDSVSNGRFGFTILGQVGGYYRIQSSSNLTDWSDETSFPVDFDYFFSSGPRSRTAIVYNGQYTIQVPQSGSVKFYRAAPYVHTDANEAVCVNILAMTRFAKDLWGSELDQNGDSQPSSAGLPVYMKNEVINGIGSSLCCPSGGFLVIKSLGETPTCTFSSGHALNEPEY